MGMDRWVFRRNDKVLLHEENDGYTYMRRGPEASETELARIDGKFFMLTNGKPGNNISGTTLDRDANMYFDAIEREQLARSETAAS